MTSIPREPDEKTKCNRREPDEKRNAYSVSGRGSRTKDAMRKRSARAHMDRLMQIVDEQKSTSSLKVATELSIKQVSLIERDDRVLPGYIGKNHGSAQGRQGAVTSLSWPLKSSIGFCSASSNRFH